MILACTIIMGLVFTTCVRVVDGVHRNSPEIHAPNTILLPFKRCPCAPSPSILTSSQDFITRVAFNESSEVRFTVDGVHVSTAEVDQQYGLYRGSCVLLEAQVGVGRHTVRVEPLRAGEPFVAISHVLYPA